MSQLQLVKGGRATHVMLSTVRLASAILFFLAVCVKGDEQKCSVTVRFGSFSSIDKCLIEFYESTGTSNKGSVSEWGCKTPEQNKPLLRVVTDFPDRCVEYKAVCYDVDEDNDQIIALGLMGIEIPTDSQTFSVDCSGGFVILSKGIAGFGIAMIFLIVLLLSFALGYVPYKLYKKRKMMEENVELNHLSPRGETNDIIMGETELGSINLASRKTID